MSIHKWGQICGWGSAGYTVTEMDCVDGFGTHVLSMGPVWGAKHPVSSWLDNLQLLPWGISVAAIWAIIILADSICRCGVLLLIYSQTW